MPATLRTTSPGESPCEPLVTGKLAGNAVTVTENVHRSFLKLTEGELSELLQEPVTMIFEGAGQSSFGTELSGTGAGDRAIELTLSPLRGSGFLIFPSALLFRVLDILLATPENTPKDDVSGEASRSVTGIELYILREFFEVFARSLRAAWEPVYPAAFSQIPPSDDAGSGPPELDDESALVLRASILLAGLAAEVRLILPTFLPRMAQIKSEAAVGRDGRGERPAGSVIKCIGGASLSLEAVLGGARIRIRDLLGMTPGQILTIGNSEDSSFECLVNGQEYFTGALVASGGRCALRIDALTGKAEGQLAVEVPDR